MANPPSNWIIQQPCPFPGCSETLTFDVTQINNDDVVKIKAVSTPESTAHAYSHQEPAK